MIFHKQCYMKVMHSPILGHNKVAWELIALESAPKAYY